MKDFYQKYHHWLNSPELDTDLKKELKTIENDATEIQDRFYKDLAFGTGGLRGLIGAGTNRINIYTIRKATQGLANFLNKNSSNQRKKVIIAYDSRKKSKEFALQAGLVLAKNNIQALIFSQITPTPILSFAVYTLQASAGIVITASHNPKEYNGYKVYGEHGGQITDSIANTITKEIEEIEDELKIEILSQTIAEEKSLLSWLDDAILNSYIERVKNLILDKKMVEKNGQQLSIIYTPLHGTGLIPVTKLLNNHGFSNLHIVQEQEEPDENFSTVKFPNPEEKEAFNLALKLAKEKKADLILGTDPDADRVGVIVKNRNEEYIQLTGNQLGSLLIDYILLKKKETNSLPNNGIIIKTIVTSDLGIEIAKKYGIKYLNVLTGFKYIGEKIAEFEKDNTYQFIFGYEESYGYLAGDFVRDKDAVQICLLTAEMATYYKTKGMTLYERLEEIFQEYGYYQEELVNLVYKGLEGQKCINRIMNYFRRNDLRAIENLKIITITDYLKKIVKNQYTKTETQINLPKSNVLHYTLEDNSWFCIRPSGTEPKLKIYFGVKDNTLIKAQKKLSMIKNFVLKKINNL